MNKLGVAVTLALLVGTTVATPQDLRIGESCDLAISGGDDKESFLQFDRELRTALSEEDPVIMSLLVGFPLRVNSDGGTIQINNAAALQSRFQEIFPPAIRSAVLDQRLKFISCNSRGIMYANGLVWVEITMQGRYQIFTINLPDIETEGAPKPKLNFVCDAEQHRVVIDLNADGTPRYRAWNKPRSLTEPPDLEIATGTKHYEGSGPCGYPVWKFHADDVTYTLFRGGCSTDSDPPFKGSRGSFGVKVGRKSQQHWTCY